MYTHFQEMLYKGKKNNANEKSESIRTLKIQFPL